MFPGPRSVSEKPEETLLGEAGSAGRNAHNSMRQELHTFLSPMPAGLPGSFTPAEQPDGLDACRRDRTGLRLEVPQPGPAGTRRMDDGSALILAPCSSIHTFFMRFAIDVLFVNNDGRVRRCIRLFPRGASPIALGAFAAIELPAGTAAASDTRPATSSVLARRSESARHRRRRCGWTERSSAPARRIVWSQPDSAMAAGTDRPARSILNHLIQDVSTLGHTQQL